MNDVAEIGRLAARARDGTRELRVSAAAGAVMVATGLAGLLSVVGADSRWLAALGAAIARAGRIPHGVPFAAAPTAHWPNVPVLGELLFHALLGVGPRGLLIAQLAAVAIALSAIAVDARALGARDGQAAVVVVIAAPSAASHRESAPRTERSPASPVAAMTAPAAAGTRSPRVPPLARAASRPISATSSIPRRL